MEDWEIECLECGWRGMVADTYHTPENAGAEVVPSCPDCGSPELLNRAERNETA